MAIVRIDGRPCGPGTLPRPGSRTASARCAFLGLVGLVLWALLPSHWFSAGPLRFRETLRHDGLNRIDYERRERGYYESLLDTQRQLGELGSVAEEVAAGDDEPFAESPLVTPVDDVREYVLRPDLETTHLDVSWRTNAWGLRDRDYVRDKPADVVRIALIGDSIAAGWGVPDGAGFEPRLEERLDAWSSSHGGPRIEVLNFAVPGHAPGQRWKGFREIAAGLDIDVVLYEATPADPGWDERRLRSLLARGIGWDEPIYADLLDRAGLRRGDDAEMIRAMLRPRRWELLEAVYRQINEELKRRDVPSIFVLIPRVGRDLDPDERDRLLSLARDSGFSACIDLSAVYEGITPADLAIAPDDYHPNIDGHLLLTAGLGEALTGRSRLRQVWWPGPTSTPEPAAGSSGDPAALGPTRESASTGPSVPAETENTRRPAIGASSQAPHAEPISR